MNNTLSPDEVKSWFPAFTEAELRKTIADQGQIHRIPAGTVIMDYGQYVRMMPLVMEGSIKISRQSDDGSELFLYYLTHGDTCAMTFGCASVATHSEIRAVAVEDVTLLGLPKDRFSEWMMRYRSWSQFVLDSYSRRLSELIFTVDQVAFHQLDVRLHEYIQKRANLTDGVTVNATHRDIAEDLNVSREAVSRLLKTLQKRGTIKLSRNTIELAEVA
ncbi:Crp/Fnr family transcriptional regulator [Lewinella sp. IMCC34191]|uniref:Crp/Fnr family transcriptional regulator n=1 Tax=Lewinella sp. IMCC34191 TaxID=2259172 RepID=UPI000E2849DD|nr:Crp/Fnr family transcriptional regulator [Lewinella sp. IMCC34191]